MMSEVLVTLTIDGTEVSVPRGTLLVDAAKQIGIDVPVFCYHPKLEPAGMCRMCLVEIGRPARDRATGELLRDEQGGVVISYGPKLETACTARVDDGWVVKVNSSKAIGGRNQIVEFLLTSHPLDCPVCDKGGECPLQNLTMEHGPGESRFIFDEKNHLEKHVPLGDLIFLDRERCIQCGRCVRFQEEIAGDPVLEFTQRGRSMQIATFSDPGFDSYFSGNTTDICPVGALTTADFRFGARTWELNSAASICTHCPVGCNLMLNTRREAKSGGREVVKRVMPRQNEMINEIWICDKGRLGHHYAGSTERVSQPLVRKNGELTPASWDDALQAAAEGLRSAGNKVVGLAGGRTSNEDLFNFKKLITGLGGTAYLDDLSAGGSVVQQVGVGQGTNLGQLGAGDAILVFASDLHEEAPIWWLRIKQAAERGASLVVANTRTTKLDTYASHVLRYRSGEAVQTALALLQAVSDDGDLKKYSDTASAVAADVLAGAENTVIFYGSEGLDFSGMDALAKACGAFLSASNHTGKPNNGLIPVWPRANTQGALDMGLEPLEDYSTQITPAEALIVMAADPVEDLQVEPGKQFTIVLELNMSATTSQADVVFPAQSFIERDGTFTSGERVVQRFYTAVQAWGDCLPDWQILARLGRNLEINLEADAAIAVVRNIASEITGYADISYQSLAHTEDQWPSVGDDDLYFGGTAYKNYQGLGVRLASAAENGEAGKVQWVAPVKPAEVDGIQLVPVSTLYDQGITLTPSKLLDPRRAPACVALHPDDGVQLGVIDGSNVSVAWNGNSVQMIAQLDPNVPVGTALVPRSLGVNLRTPVSAEIKPVE
jgi:NADH-quinone oxidoreductase subunit G